MGVLVQSSIDLGNIPQDAPMRQYSGISITFSVYVMQIRAWKICWTVGIEVEIIHKMKWWPAGNAGPRVTPIIRWCHIMRVHTLPSQVIAVKMFPSGPTDQQTCGQDLPIKKYAFSFPLHANSCSFLSCSIYARHFWRKRCSDSTLNGWMDFVTKKRKIKLTT